MPNGCMCCRVRGDLTQAIRNILATQTNGLDGILIELSGLSELAPVVQTFYSDTFVQQNVQLDAVVCVCDATSVLENVVPGSDTSVTESSTNSTNHINEYLSDSLKHHILLSDRVLLNKIDLLDENVLEQKLPQFQQFVQSINPNSQIIPTSMGSIDISRILNLDAFSLSRSLSLDREFSNLFDPQTRKRSHIHHKFSSVGIEIKDEPVDSRAFEKLILQVLQNPNICRTKAVIWTSTGKRSIVQSVFSHIQQHSDTWANGQDRMSQFVFIGVMDENIRQELKESVDACRMSRVSQQSAASSGFSMSGPLAPRLITPITPTVVDTSQPSPVIRDAPSYSSGQGNAIGRVKFGEFDL
eukprot:c7853_g1_i1.p1 GENE.c7853_g1_i1~~c7853_g1_i1.p1  ORF type:complete len:356 (-),score=102.62 c7853_g1_i1:10-1077(-)